jgi:hypothetical protein
VFEIEEAAHAAQLQTTGNEQRATRHFLQRVEIA